MYTYPKNFLSVTQLIQKLKDTGMTIDSNDTTEMALTTIGYYRLKGYSFHLIDPSTKKYIEGTSLSDILRLYHFDLELSDLLFSYLSQIEVALKSQLVNAFQITHDALVLNDPSVFKDKKTFWKNQSTIASEISRLPASEECTDYLFIPCFHLSQIGNDRTESLLERNEPLHMV